MKRFFLNLAIAIIFAGGFDHGQFRVPQAQAADLAQGDAALAGAFNNRSSRLQVQGRGVVASILRDDTDGRRHQRFVLRLGSGQTILIAHNIDLAPRIESIQAGDSVEFYGEYEWNSKGGTVHWTHRDPAGRHVPGWLKHHGKTYQ